MGAIATTRQNVTVVEEQEQYLTFMLGTEMFAIGILGIKEIIEYGNLTVVPMMPAFVRGVINLRGSVVPVIDLQARFGKGATLQSNRTCVVILELIQEDESHVLGIVVDSVSEVIEIELADIKAAPAIGNRIREDFIRGMVKIRGAFLTVLQLDQVLCVREIASQLH